MSNADNNPTPIIVHDVQDGASDVEKPNFIKKSTNFIKSHKKATIAVVLLGGLVGAAALTGRATAPSHDFDTALDINNDVPDVEFDPETDTTVA